MDFTNGVKARVVIGCYSKTCTNSEDLYDFLTGHGIDHGLAANAQGWSELAGVGETYNEEEFDIYMEEGLL